MSQQFKSTSKYTAFNARFLTDQEVAQSFIPTPQFKVLLSTAHSILMGPRGCGKTTLLKMLSKRAFDVWAENFAIKGDIGRYTAPDFLAVYIPSDSRWAKEINSLGELHKLDVYEVEKIQRILIALSILSQWTIKFDEELEGKSRLRIELASKFIETWGLEGAAPSFIDIRSTITKIASDIRGQLIFGKKAESLLMLPASIHSNLIDICSICADLYSSVETGKNPKWAICFDELEISPKWMQDELISSLRSVDQRLLLKLTWSPVLPAVIKNGPENLQDVDFIRLWYSHIADARQFCNSLADRVVKDVLSNDSITALSVFGRSTFVSDSGDDYERGSEFYRSMQSLASVDNSFSSLLIKYNVDPNDPFSEDQSLRDSLFRKIKPVVLIRETFIKDNRRRSRKRPHLYCGLDMIFSMSEGNPRRLIKLLNDLIDLGYRDSISPSVSSPLISYMDQARILSSLSSQFLSYVKSIPSEAFGEKALTLFDLINAIGSFFSSNILGDEFPLDPVGSFVVDNEVDSKIEAVLRVGLDCGAIIYIGSSPNEVADKILGSRFRITFMLSPKLKLLARNYKEVPLQNCLGGTKNLKQLSIFDI